MPALELRDGDLPLIRQRIQSAYTGIMRVNELLQLVQDVVPEVGGALPIRAGADELVFELVNAAHRRGLLPKLIVAAAERRPHRHDLRELQLVLAQRPGWSLPTGAHTLSPGSLERLTSAGEPFLDVPALARWLLAVENQVCQVKAGAEAGTGFLVGANLVLTCYHVVESHLDGTVPASEVKVRFGYKVGPGGKTPPDADLRWHAIDDAWTIPHSRYGEADVSLTGEPAADELDYALIKLQSSPGSDTVPEGGQRGWVDISSDPALPAAESPILIVQHPGQPPEGEPPQQPLKIAFATPGFERANANGTRVGYRPSTLKGSSGSPVFDAKYRCVALHHNRGQISAWATHIGDNNRGIPIREIRRHLADDVRALLSAPQ